MMSRNLPLHHRIAYRYLLTAGALTDVSKLRYQAVFLMGAGGSGKSYVGQRWMKYMPGGGATGIDFNNPKHQDLSRGSSPSKNVLRRT